MRGKPIIVAPVDADTTCAIAASYEAKRFGIKTGTQVAEAKRLCPGLIVVNGRHAIYSQYHQRVLDAVDHVLPVERVCSIDEMRFQLIGDETRPARAIELAHRLKREIRERVGQCMTCSIGIAPNAFLAKLATEMQKPDGLVVLQAQDLPDQVRHLKLTDFTGINRRMQARLQANGIFSVEQLYAASPQELKRAFGSVVGERWWYLLRGYDAEQEVGRQKTLSNSHVLPPGLRTDDGCREVLLRLIQKATARLRADGLRAQGMAVSVSGFSRSWKEHIRLDGTSDTVAVNDLFQERADAVRRRGAEGRERVHEDRGAQRARTPRHEAGTRTEHDNTPFTRTQTCPEMKHRAGKDRANVRPSAARDTRGARAAVPHAPSLTRARRSRER